MRLGCCTHVRSCHLSTMRLSSLVPISEVADTYRFRSHPCSTPALALTSCIHHPSLLQASPIALYLTQKPKAKQSLLTFLYTQLRRTRLWLLLSARLLLLLHGPDLDHLALLLSLVGFRGLPRGHVCLCCLMQKVSGRFYSLCLVTLLRSCTSNAGVFS